MASFQRRRDAFGAKSRRLFPPVGRNRLGSAAGMAGGMASTGMKQLSVRCCVVGGGPAGMMLGLLLARAGIDVVVLEKHADFLRDFRGDTIHPSTLQMMVGLGLLDDLLKLPHKKVARLGVQ